MSTVICRTGYCQECANRHRPHKGSLFLAYGSHRGGYYVREASTDGTLGFVPHLFILKQVTKEMICIVSTVCCLYDCGVEKIVKSGKTFYSVKKESWKTIFMSTADWNNLLLNMKGDKQYQL